MEHLTKQQKEQYDLEGYVIVRNFFSKPEIDILYSIATDDQMIKKNAFDLNDQSGKKTKLTLWFTPGSDAYGLLTRSERMVKGARLLLEEDNVCHFHSKLMQKEPKVGGAWEWHQDYGYWYKNGFLYPDALISVMVALTEANIENGCLQVIKGSHKLGRVEHSFAGDQQGADMEFVNECLKTLEHVYVELQPGDTLFFHSNLLHRSEANNADYPRWSLISAYNLSYNIPFKPNNSSCTTILETVPDSAILEHDGKGLSDASDFLEKDMDEALKK